MPDRRTATMQNNVIDLFLETSASEKKQIYITLRDNTVVAGIVGQFDGYSVFLDGEPGKMLYRHSILKLSDIPAPSKNVERGPRINDARPQREVREQKPREDRPRPQQERRPAPRPQRKPVDKRPDRRPEPVQTEEKSSDGLGIMADAMQKWLNSRKGDE